MNYIIFELDCIDFELNCTIFELSYTILNQIALITYDCTTQ